MTDLSIIPEHNDGPQQAAHGTGIELCKALEGLAAINKPDIDLVIWRRTLPVDLRTWLEQLEFADLPHLRILVRPAQLREALESKLNDSNLPGGTMRDLLVQDIKALVSTFADIARTDLVDIRLERVDHDACKKFHRDCVEARLITTYLGPATEWVEKTYAEQALRDQKQFSGPLERLKAHDVAFFTGSCAGPGSGIVHRSPPIADTGHTRLLLCLNKPSGVSPKPWQEDSTSLN